jgi:hypothetical protein
MIFTFKNKTEMKKLLFTLLLSMICLVAQPAYYYLSYSGSDSNDGLSRYEAFKTFTKASAEMAPGDYLVCDGAGGTYFADTSSMVFTRAGTAASLIHILGVNEFTIATNTENLTYIDLSGSNYLLIDNIKFNTITYTDSLYVKLGHSTSGTSKYYYINNCFFETGSCITDSISSGNHFPNLSVNASCFIDGSGYAIKAINGLSNSYSSLSINYCSFYSCEPIYLQNGDGTAYNFSITNSIISTCTNIITLNEGSISSPVHSYNIIHSYTNYCDTQVITPAASEQSINPLFESTSYHKLYLQEDSPAILYYSRAFIGALPRLSLKIGDF